MKIMKAIALMLGLIATAWAQQPTPAARYPAQITFRVLTDAGAPVPNVEVTTSTFLYWQPGEGFGRDIYEENKGRTNDEGLTTVSFTGERGDCNYGIYDVSGYYSTRNLSYKFTEVKAGRWEPWNPIIEVILKPVLKPVPMYARKIGGGTQVKIPALDKPAGFDLMVGDWVAPWGKGKSSDFIFTLKEVVPFVEGTKPFNYSLSVSFPNERDGIQPVFATPHKGSDLLLPRYAPEDGYLSKLEKQMAIFAEGKPMKYDTREDQHYFFRVRTVLDEQGRIKSALYGKISGDIKFGVNRVLRFNYYLNPTSLDRNMEFDPKNNLFTGLRSLEEIEAP